MASSIGENNTLQHTWDFSNWKKTFSQLFFQLVRNAFNTPDTRFVFGRLLTRSKENPTLREYLYRLVIHTRDIQKGKGERDLFYHLLTIMAENGLLNDAIDILRYTCNSDIGSWKDVKYLVYHIQSVSPPIETVTKAHPLARAALQMLAAQIETDYKAYNEGKGNTMSLASRWAPRREKGKFALVTKLFVQTIHASRRFNGTSMRDVRKLLSILNHTLNTPQIDMCRKTWRYLNFNSMTSYTLLKHKLAFQNIHTKTKEQRTSDEDRVECAEHYTEWLHSKDKKMNVSTVYPYEFVRNVAQKQLTDDERLYYNDAWNTQLNAQMLATRNAQHGVMIPMIDVSGSMTCDNSLPLYNAIALGIRLSEMNCGVFHNRALTFESRPKWATFKDDQTFVDKVRYTQQLGWGGSTNFEAALSMILRQFIRHQVSPLTVQNSSLVVFSDMQMNESQRTPYHTVYERIKSDFHDAGMESIYETPYDVPHVVFWNLRKTDGFPTVSNERGVTMISGYNASMIETLLNKGVRALRDMTPWDLIRETLASPRFQHSTE